MREIEEGLGNMLDKPIDTVDRRFATTLARGMSVLRAFRAGDKGLTNLELSKRTNLPRSTVSRLTFTLQKLGYLSHLGRYDVYRPGPALLALGNVALASVSFVDQAQSIMQQLAEDTGTLVVLAVHDDDKMLMIKTWRPQAVASIWLEVGHRIPIAHTSSGQCFVSALSASEFEALSPMIDEELRDEELSATDLRQHAYEQLLSEGFVISPQHLRFAKTINAVSVPYRSYEFDEPVSITCGATPEALDDERMHQQVGPLLLQAVRDLERATGQSTAMSQRG